ncbi:MAG: PxKF domain-containing protein [Pyrinomonadaceae bacterium]
MTPKAYRIAFPRKSRLGTFLSLAISLSFLTPLVPAAVGASGARMPRVAPRAALAYAPLISATKSDAFPDPDNDGKAVPGDTITYTVQINNGGTDATGVVFSDTVDPNTTFVPGSVTTTPVAIDDSYTAVGNVRINVPAASGLTANDSDPDGGTVAAVPATTTSANNGDVTVNADGSFTYNPAPGFEGADTFTYTVAGASAPSNTATVTVNVAGMIWFIDDSAAGGDGRLTSPYNSISAFNSFAADDQNDNIFLYSGNYTGGLVLESGQALIGEGATASLSAITGLTPPSYSDPLPATGGANPNIGGANGITLATNNLIRGITLTNSGGTAISGSNFGTLAVSETTINATAQALDLDNGQLNATFQSISSDGSAAAAVRLANIAVGSTFSGGATTIGNRGTTGIELDAVQGSIGFGATTVANQMGAGGYGVRVRNSGAAVSFASAVISDTNQTVAQVDTTPADGLPDNDGDGDAIFLKSNTGSFSVGGGSLTNCGNDCVDARESSNVILTNVAISAPGQDVASPTSLGVGGHGFYALNLTGTNGVSGGSVSGFNGSFRDGVLVTSNMFTQTFNVAGTTFLNATGSTGVRANASGTANVTLNVGGATNNAATNVTFDNLSGSAVSVFSDQTSTLNMTVQNSTFQNAPVNGKNNVLGLTAGTGHGSFNVLNNTFNNVFRTASTGESLINLNGLATVAGNTFSANVSGNNISNVGVGGNVCGGGAVYCAGPLQAISITPSATTNVPGTILVDGNTLTNVQQGGLLLDMAGVGVGVSAIAAKITNNVFGTNAARVGMGTTITNGFGMRVQHRVDGSSAANVLISGNSVRNGNGAAGSALNGPGIHLRTQNTTSMDVTATGNDIDTNFTGVTEMRVETAQAGSVLCLDANGNIFPAGASAVLELRETNGALNVEQASAAALATANGGVTVTTAAGTPNFGVACAAPVASLRLNTSGQYLASATAAKSARALAYLSGARTAEAFEAMPGLDAWRSNSKWLGGLSFNYAASNVALGSGLTDTVVRPARETIPTAPAFAAVPAMPVFSGETVTVNVGTLPAGKSMTITFQVTIDTPFNATQVSNQGTVSYTGGSVLTDDPATGPVGDPTVTPVGTPATISCPADISANTDPGQFSASVPFTVTATGTPNPTIDCKVGATSITSPHTFPVGTTAVQCTATNGIGSPASCSFNVTVTDNQTPAISCPANVTANTAPNSCDATVNPGTPTVNDNDPNVTTNGTRSDSQPLNAPYPKGTTTITWTATDTAGNSASCQQTVTVNDATAPVVTLNGSATMTVECHTSFADPGATATDNCGGSPSVTVSGSVNVNVVGSYTLTYSATDASGNTGTATRTVNVVDTTAPVVTLNGANPLTVVKGSVFVDPGATATDSCAGSLPVSVSGSVNTNVVGTYTLTYSATDASGNTGSATRTVFVVYNFTGFFSPVSNPPVLNEVKAGQNIPLKFSLGGNQGLAIFAPGFPASQQVNCATNVPVNVLEETETPGGSTLTYDAGSGRYQYNWKTEKSWAGTCRVLVVTFIDGSTYTANFKFK